MRCGYYCCRRLLYAVAGELWMLSGGGRWPGNLARQKWFWICVVAAAAVFFVVRNLLEPPRPRAKQRKHAGLAKAEPEADSAVPPPECRSAASDPANVRT